MTSSNSSSTKWERIYQMVAECEDEKTKGNEKTKLKSKTKLCFDEIRMMLLYPRLDINVTKHINHLLKSPFCVHPKTGLISVPLSENDIFSFDITKVPNIIETNEDFKQGR
jgi:DNA primase small subunit